MTYIAEKCTYSPEDNKLRIYFPDRLDADQYARIKSLGFGWAPIQKHFFAVWSTHREDYAIEMAGEIIADDTTLVERAEVKAERLDGYAANNVAKANAFQQSAQSFDSSQPILMGHHSEKKAVREQKKAERAGEMAVECAEKVRYFNWKAIGVERFANKKADAGTRQRRMKKLLAELRKIQRDRDHGNIIVDLWTKVRDEDISDALRAAYVERYVGGALATGQTSPSLYSPFKNGEITPEECINKCIEWGNALANGPRSIRRITHLLNRLGYERSELGPVARFEGKLTATIIKAFARDHGAFKPDCKLIDGAFELTSATPLPFHISKEKWLCLVDEDWRDLMESVGYEVPEPKAKKAPILNLNVATVTGQSRGGMNRMESEVYPVAHLTKAEYKSIYSKGTRLSSCGQFRFKIACVPQEGVEYYMTDWSAVYLTDSKEHKAPDSPSIGEALKVANGE